MLRQRILSALVLAPVAIAAAWMGGWSFALLAAVASALLGWEWDRLCMGRFGAGGVILAVMGVASAFLGLGAASSAFWVIGGAAVAAPLVRRVPGRSLLWLGFGALYIGLPTVSLVWLRSLGGETLFWLLLLVWATDIGAYAAGRTIGGPKIWVRISPNKTWAGLCGGVASAALVGWGTAAWIGDNGPNALILALLSGALAVVAQVGDFGESWVKRHFGVKDSSHIIPGHGGVLDRLDGLLVTAPVVAALCLAFGGGLPLWR